MNLPKFTAEASMYATNGYYRNNRQIHSPTQLNGLIHPAEIIEVHGCPPGWSDIGGTCWPDPLTEPSGGGGSTGIPGVPSDGDGKGGGGGTSSKPTPRPKPTAEEVAKAKEKAKAIRRCKAICEATRTVDKRACALDPHPDICRSIADNVLSRCKTRCEDEPFHNAPVM